MRRSHKGLNINRIKKDDYSGIPEDLKEFNYYYCDGETGHVVMAIPKCLLDEAQRNGDLDIFECPVPCKYVLEHGYEIVDEHIVVDVPYDTLGIDVDDKYFEL